MSNALPPSIADYLRGIAMYTRRRERLAALLRAAAVFGAWGLMACAADRALHLGKGMRAGLLGAGVLAAFVVFLWPWRPGKGRRINWVAVAEMAEMHRPVFAQRLVTLVSRLMGPVEHRGSAAMLAQLRAEVEERIAQDPYPKIGSAHRRLLWPAMACAGVIIASAGLLRMPGLELPRLAVRFALPWRAMPAVTTTQLVVQPDGDVYLTDSAELRIDVTAEHLGDGVVSLLTQPAEEPIRAGKWSRLTMDQIAPGPPARFQYVFAGIDRDLRYYVAGGDAVSRVYSVRVLRKPAVSTFRIRYRYPAYVGRPAATVASGDGQLEAPLGTIAEVTLTATEPLQSAMLRLDSQSIALSPTADATTFVAAIPIEHNESGALDMISTRHVTGSMPVQIRALPMRPPMLRVTDASGEPGATLSANPRQVLPVAFEAQDDYGLQGLSLRWRVNGTKNGESAVAIPEGVRHIQDVVDFDLASLPLRVGDVLTVWLEAHNTAGLKTASQPIEALMAARPVDAEMRQRLAALDAAAGFADRLAGHLAAAQAGSPPGTSPEIKSAQASVALSSATEDAGLLRQSLLRVIALQTSPQDAIALAGWVDQATEQSFWADRSFRQIGDSGTTDCTTTPKFADRIAAAQSLRQELRALDQGWWAQTSLAEWDDVKNSDRHSGAAARIRQDAIDDAKTAACTEGADLLQQLAAKSTAADALVAGKGPVDFVPPARDWVSDVTASPPVQSSLPQRLRSAAEAEALRQHGDLPAARDLELSSRAADALEELATDERMRVDIRGFVDALNALQRERRMDAAALSSPADQQTVRQSAAARQQMERWALRAEGVAPHVAGASHAGASPRWVARSAESKAISAAASLATRHSPTSRLTAPIIAGSHGGPGASPARVRSNVTMSEKVVAAQQIDTIDQNQQELLQQTAVAKPAEAPSLAQRQQQVADSIATVAAGSEPAAIAGNEINAPNWREREAAALSAIGQQLAEMPQQLAVAQDSLGDATAAMAHAASAQAQVVKLQRSLGNANSAELIRAAQRAAQQSSSDADDAARRLEQSMQPVAAARAQEMARALAPFAPEAAAARSTIEDQLAPVLAGFEKAVRSRDALAADRAAGAARNAIGAAQQGIADATDALAARDPLVTASSSARAAVASLRRSPPDFSTAVRHQTQVTLALSRAWDQSVHGAAADRLAQVPGLQPLFVVGAAIGAGGTGPAPLAAQVSPASGQPWAWLPMQSGNAGGGADSADPAGYEDALRLYFQALGQAQKDAK